MDKEETEETEEIEETAQATVLDVYDEMNQDGGGISRDEIIIWCAGDLAIIHGWPTPDLMNWSPVEEKDQENIKLEVWDDEEVFLNLNGIPYAIVPPGRFTLRVYGEETDCYWNGAQLIDVEKKGILFDSNEGKLMN
jgi:hypothetical protein